MLVMITVPSTKGIVYFYKEIALDWMKIGPPYSYYLIVNTYFFKYILVIWIIFITLGFLIVLWFSENAIQTTEAQSL